MSCVKIIGVNDKAERLCACAARISTTKGDALALLAEGTDIEKDRRLIANVLSSGHQSFLEHAVFTLAFCNVSAVVEQFMIEFRLASFTIKSRRYVDFGKMGYYIPEEFKGETELARAYKEFTEAAFKTYGELLEDGVPKEDARFVLPYSFCSNFYCTVNARELCRIIREMRYGSGVGNGELGELAEQLTEQLKTLFPALLSECENQKGTISPKHTVPEVHIPTPVEWGCDLVAFTENSDQILNLARQLECSGSGEGGGQRTGASDHVSPWAQEHISGTFLLRNVSLSGITHIVRHRIQSIIVPPIVCALAGRYVVPKSVEENGEALAKYTAIFHMQGGLFRLVREAGYEAWAMAYLCLSGNTLDLMTTMNAREMELFFRLRCCERAQWEVRGLAGEMLSLAKGQVPMLFRHMGPGCVIDGACSEGRLSCGKFETVREKFLGGA